MVSVLLTIAAAFIPNVVFTYVIDVKKANSVAALMSSAWSMCRENISNEQAIAAIPAIQSYSLWTMIGVVVALAVAALSLGFSLWGAVTALRILRQPDFSQTVPQRVTLCRVFPNEWWLLAANWLIIIPALFPYYVSAMYTYVLHANTSVRSGLTVVAVVLAVVSGIVTAVSSKFEKQMGIYPFDIK